MLSPHVRAARCSIEAARIVREAAEKAGAPPGLIQWIEKPSLTLATALMKDPKINLILATGARRAAATARAFCLQRWRQQHQQLRQLPATRPTLSSRRCLPPAAATPPIRRRRQAAPAWCAPRTSRGTPRLASAPATRRR